MQTAKDCRRKVAEMNALAARSPALREQFLQMAEVWERLERESARAEGRNDQEAGESDATR
jgi:hypothetical protein